MRWACFAALAACGLSAKFSSDSQTAGPVSRLLHLFRGDEPQCSKQCVEPRGSCVSGRCVCKPGFAGASCEEVKAPPAPEASIDRVMVYAEDVAAERAKRIAAAVKARRTQQKVEAPAPLQPAAANPELLKEALQASHNALLTAASVHDAEESRRAAAANEAILADSPLRDATGIMDKIGRYLKPASTTLGFVPHTTTQGPNASKLEAPMKAKSGECLDNCNGHGSCANGVCSCGAGWTGEACDIVTCPSNCNARGSCIGGSCACNFAFYGAACEYPRCKNDCNGHGYCDSGKCVCNAGYHGAACDEFKEPQPVTPAVVSLEPSQEAAERVSSFGEKVRSIAPPSCPEDCNQRGRCELDGTCTCIANYTGLACEHHCPSSCNGQGTCTGGQCVCFFGWGGVDCSMAMCCNGHGDCPTPGSCKCHPGWMGEQCEIEIKCPDPDCSGHGTCFLGTCRCQAGWAGAACHQYVPPPLPPGQTAMAGVMPGGTGAFAPMQGYRAGAPVEVYPGMIGAAGLPLSLAQQAKHETGQSAKEAMQVQGSPDCNAPHGRWSEDLKACVCEAPHHGERCEEKHCDDWDGTEGGTECSGNGVCQQGKCFCLPGFGLANNSSNAANICADMVCLADCGSHGECKDGACICETGWQGATCAEPKCLDDCSGHGRCLFPHPDAPAECLCQDGYTAPNCAERISEASPPLRGRHVELAAVRLN